MLLENKEYTDADIFLAKSLRYFKVDDSVFKGRERIKTEIKHLIRYGMYKNGISFSDISRLTKCERTSIFYAIEVVKDLSSVDKDFSKKVEDYLKFIS